MLELILFKDDKYLICFFDFLNFNISIKANTYMKNCSVKIPPKPTNVYNVPAHNGPTNLVALLDNVSIAKEELSKFLLILSTKTRLLTAKSTTQVIPLENASMNANITLKLPVKTKKTAIPVIILDNV